MAKKSAKSKEKAKTGKGKFDLKAALKKAAPLWKKAKKGAADATRSIEFDDGKYTAKCVGATIEKSGAGRLQVLFKWKFLNGDFEGKTKHAYQGIETEDNLKFLARDLVRLGYDTEAMDDLTEDLPKILEEISEAKPVAAIKLKTKGEFQNVYIDKLLGADDEDEDAEDEEDDEEDDDTDDDEDSDEDGDDEDADEDEDDEDDDDDEEEDDDDEEDSDDEDDEDSDDEDEEEDDEDEDEDGDEDEASDDEVAVSVGMSVYLAGKKKGEKITAEVTAVDEDENELKVRTEAGKKLTVSVDDILGVVEEKKKKGKSAKKAPAKKGKKAKK